MKKFSIGRTVVASLVVVALGVAIYTWLGGANRLPLGGKPEVLLQEGVSTPAKPSTETQHPSRGSSGPDVSLGNSEAMRLFETALQKLSTGDTSLARETFERIRRDYPDTPVATSASFQLGKILLKEGEKYEARGILSRILDSLSESERDEAIELLDSINRELIFSPARSPDAIFYRVRKGDTFDSIAKRFATTVGLLKRVNNHPSDLLQVGQTLKVIRGTWSIRLSKSKFRLTLFLNGNFVKEYPVGIGAYDKTPTGTFIIDVKQKNPTWYTGGEAIPFGDPRNLLGTRWMGFKKRPDLSGYGIHGTDDPSSIGKAVSNGCIRMLNADVEELYDIVPFGTEVTIVE